MSNSTTPNELPIPRKPVRRCFRVHGIPMEWTLETTHSRHSSGKAKTALVTFEPTLPPGLTENAKISVDGHDVIFESCNGLTTLFDPPDGVPVTADILFVHGLGGHSVGSWTTPKDFCWPRDALGNDLCNARIMTFGYEAKLNRDTSTSRLSDFGIELLNELLRIRKINEHRQRPLFLIGHSFGGTVISWVLHELVTRKERLGYQPTLRAIRCVTFFGSPIMGMDIQYLEPITEGRKSASMKRTLEDLRPTSEVLNTLRTTLADLHQIQFITCLEQQLTSAQGSDGKFTGESYHAVDALSARLHTPTEKVVTIDADHRNMIKFGHKHERHYEKIRDHLKEALELCRRSLSGPCLNPDQRKVLLNSLRMSDPGDKGVNNRPTDKDACDWLFTTTEYREWISGPEGPDARAKFLCIAGPEGSGKSSLIHRAMEHHKARFQGHYTAAFFFDGNEACALRTITQMCQSLLSQLLESMPQIPSEVIPPERLSAQFVWQPFALEELLESVIPLLEKPLFCFIDASSCTILNLPDLIQFLDRIAAIAEHKSKLRLCLTWRNDIDPTNFAAPTAHISLQYQKGHNRDIIRFISQRLAMGQTKFSQKCCDQLTEKAEGSFLWARMALEMLDQDRSEIQNAGGIMERATILERIESFPPGLPQLCGYILKEGDRQQDTNFILLLRAVNQSLTPPKAEEMYRLTRSTKDFFRRPSKEFVVQHILTLSRGLLEATGRNVSRVQFIHNCIPELLDSLAHANDAIYKSVETSPGEAHERIKNDCLAILRRLNDDTTDLDTAIYGIENVIPSANEAQRLGVPQVDFLKSFPLTDWIQLTNVANEHPRYAPNASLTYVLADMDMSDLILAHPGSIQSYLLPEPDMTCNALLTAISKMNTRTISALLELERERMRPMRLFSDSRISRKEHEKLCAQYITTLQERQKSGAVQHIISPESSRLSNLDAVIDFMKRPGNEMLHLFLILAGRVEADRQTFDSINSLVQSQQSLAASRNVLQTPSRELGDVSVVQQISEVQSRGAAMEYFDSFITHPDGYLQPMKSRKKTDTPDISRSGDGVDMDGDGLRKKKPAKTSKQKKSDALVDSSRATSSRRKALKNSTVQKRKVGKTKSAANCETSDEDELPNTKAKLPKPWTHRITKADNSHKQPIAAMNTSSKNSTNDSKAHIGHSGGQKKGAEHQSSKSNGHRGDGSHGDGFHSNTSHTNTRTFSATEITSKSPAGYEHKPQGLYIFNGHAPSNVQSNGPYSKPLQPSGPRFEESSSSSSSSDSSNSPGSSSDFSSDSPSSDESESSNEQETLDTASPTQQSWNSQAKGQPISFRPNIAITNNMYRNSSSSCESSDSLSTSDGDHAPQVRDFGVEEDFSSSSGVASPYSSDSGSSDEQGYELSEGHEESDHESSESEKSESSPSSEIASESDDNLSVESESD